MKLQGFVQLHRASMESTVWDDDKTWKLWCWCLMRARHSPGKVALDGKDIDLAPGQFVTGRKSALRELGTFSPQNYKTALGYLKATNRITIYSTNRYSIITVSNWKLYQADNQQSNKRATKSPPSPNQQTTTNNNEEKEDTGDKGKNVSSEVTFPINLDTPECRQEWSRWLGHKSARKESYKTLDSQEAQLRRCAKALVTPDRFLAAIEFSIGQNYSGLFEERSQTGAKKTSFEKNPIAENGYSEAFNHNMAMLQKIKEGKL